MRIQYISETLLQNDRKRKDQLSLKSWTRSRVERCSTLHFQPIFCNVAFSLRTINSSSKQVIQREKKKKKQTEKWKSGSKQNQISESAQRVVIDRHWCQNSFSSPLLLYSFVLTHWPSVSAKVSTKKRVITESQYMPVREHWRTVLTLAVQKTEHTTAREIWESFYCLYSLSHSLKHLKTLKSIVRFSRFYDSQREYCTNIETTA